MENFKILGKLLTIVNILKSNFTKGVENEENFTVISNRNFDS